MNISKTLRRAVTAVQAKVTEQVKKAPPVKLADTFERAVAKRTVSIGNVSVQLHAGRSTGANVRVGSDVFGAALKAFEGPATLGVLTQKVGKEEVSVGLVPAAPSPLPLVVYAGPVREE